VEIIDSGEDNVSLIFCFGENEVFDIQEFKDIIVKVQNACLQYFELSLTAGIGSIEDDIRGIYYSYRNAFNATNYRLIYGEKSILEYIEIVKANQVNYQYPYEIEKNIINALKSAEKEKADKALAVFLNEISQYSYDEIQLALNQLMIITFRALKSILVSEEIDNLGIHEDYRLITETFHDLDTLEQVHVWLREFYSNVLEFLKKKRENKNEDIISRIKMFIEENYHNSNISVEMLASMVGLSPNYIRKLFKEDVGKSISVYLNELRFEKAMEMLVNTDYSAGRIAEMAGFTVGGYFFTAFKRFTGFSPDEYRRINSKRT
jgi:AraC-like DNA-binding protein